MAATALVLIALGTVVHSLGESWSDVGGFSFAVATLTTSSMAIPIGS